jgi:hypothetical protein
MSFKNLEGQTACWIQRLQEYDFTSERHQGWKHNRAAALSQRPCQEECIHCQRVEVWAEVNQVWAVATNGCDPAALRRDQLNDQDMGPILEEVEAEQHPEWKDIADHNPTYKGYWAKWKSLAVRDGILKRHWESTNGQSKAAHVLLPRCKVKEVLAKLHGGPSGGCLDFNKTLDKVRQRYYWLQLRHDVEERYQRCDFRAASWGPQTSGRGLIHPYEG